MNQTKMPEPVAYLACNHETNKPEWSESCVCEDPVFTLDDTGTISRGVVFVDQAEAYANTRVREALEEAAAIVDEYTATDMMVCRIRALIPKEPPCDT